jgi:hypothetical protein
MTLSNPDSLSSSETRVDHGITWNKKLKNELFWRSRCQKAIGEINFAKKWRAVTLQRGLTLDNIKPWLESGIFKCIS